MNNDNKIIGVLMVIFAGVLLVTYLFFGMEKDVPQPANPEKPIPQLKEEAPKKFGMSGEYE